MHFGIYTYNHKILLIDNLFLLKTSSKKKIWDTTIKNGSIHARKRKRIFKDKIRYFSQENNLQLEETAQFPHQSKLK